MAVQCLSVDDCNKLLHINKIQKAKWKLSNFTLEQFNKNLRGYLGEHLLLTLDIDTEAGKKKLTYFVKYLSEYGMASLYLEHKVFEKELFVYNFFNEVSEVLPDVHWGIVPKMFYYAQNTLVLENLSRLGYAGYESMLYDKPHMFSILNALAKFHSVTFAYERYKSAKCNRKYELSDDYEEYFETAFTDREGTNGAKYMKASEIGALTLIDLIYNGNPKMKTTIKNYIPKFLELLCGRNNYTKVLSHGDVWAFNALFKYENGTPIDCKLIDFQLIRYAPPAHDVTLAIYFCSDLKLNCTQEYYEYYYKSLTFELNKLNIDINTVVPRNEYDETCKLYMPAAKFIWLCYRQLSEAHEDFIKDLFSDFDLCKSVMLDNERADYIKDIYEKDPNFRIGLKKIIRDNTLNEYIIIEDCYNILQQELGSNTPYQLLECSFDKLDKYGFLAEHYKLQMELQLENKRATYNYFVKIEPSSKRYKEFNTGTKCDYKEMQFYKTIVPELLKYNINIIQDVVPRCYMSYIDKIVLQDLKSSGYITISAREILTREVIIMGIISLAKLHAAGIIYEEKITQATGKLCRLNELYPDELIESLYSTNYMSTNLLKAGKKGLAVAIKQLSNHTNSITPEDFINQAHKIIDQYYQLSLPSKKYRNTINHGDIWSGNIMFNLEKSKAVLVDFQCNRYGPPARDFMQFIYFTSDRNCRQQHFDSFKQIYHAEFKKCLEEHNINVNTVLTYDDFLESCQEEKKFAVAQVCTHFQNILIDPRKMDEFFDDVEFCEKSLFEDRSELVQRLVDSDPVYVKRLTGVIDEYRLLCEEELKLRK